MPQRLAALLALATLSALALGALAAGGRADTAPARISFEIATGSTAGTLFPVGEAIAGLVSHPPGMDRCQAEGVCGPPGLIVSARASEGAADNLLAVNSGAADSGLAQADVIAAAVAGRGLFRRHGRLVHVRVIASLFSEDVHLVVAAGSKIAGVADLKGKRVSLGSDGSGVTVTAREILAAWRLPESALKPVHEDVFNAIQMMKEGRLDAFFVLGGVPIDALGDLLAHSQARLVPIEGAGRDRLIRMVPSLAAAQIPAGAYGGKAAVETVASRTLWIVRDSVSEPLVYGLTRALFNPANRDELAASHPAAREIELAQAAADLPAPLHPGAAKFYSEHLARR